MKRDEEKVIKPPVSNPHQDQAISSTSVENAHASGDGTVKKTDELQPDENNDDSSSKKTPY